jgi:hypothetical protein
MHLIGNILEFGEQLSEAVFDPNWPPHLVPGRKTRVGKRRKAPFDRTAVGRIGDTLRGPSAAALLPRTTKFGTYTYFGSQLPKAWYACESPIAAKLMRPPSLAIVMVQLRAPWTPSSTIRFRRYVTRSTDEARSDPSGL